MIKKSEVLPNKVKTMLEKGKIIMKDWNDNNLSSLLNDCNNIEKNIKIINFMNNKINKCKSKKRDFKFYEIDNKIDLDLKHLGGIINKKYKYSFIEYPSNIEENKKYIIYKQNAK